MIINFKEFWQTESRKDLIHGGKKEETMCKTPKAFQGCARQVPSYDQTNHNYEEEETIEVFIGALYRLLLNR